MRPRLLDLFCGAGGSGKGYADAGFEVVGVDVVDQPRYPFPFVRADALEVLGDLVEGRSQRWPTSEASALPVVLEGISHFDAIHASPPCPAYSLVSGFQGVSRLHPDLVGPVRARLAATGLPSVIENVPGAPLRRDVVLCGEMFGLRLHRHRIFEVTGPFVMQPPHSRHRLRGASTNCETGPGVARWFTGNYADHDDAGDAMGIDWMDRRELANAIPPAYCAHIGTYLMQALRAERAAA